MGLTYNQFKKKFNADDANKPVDISGNYRMEGDSERTYDWYKQMRDNGQVAYDTDVVKDYFNQAQKLFSGMPKEGESPNYDWASNTSKETSDKIKKLSESEDYVKMYLDSIKDKPEYEQLSKQFSDYRTALTHSKDYLDGLYGLASQYDNEDDYNSAMTEINRQQKYKDYSYDDLIKASNESEDEDEAEWLNQRAEEVGSIDDLKKTRDSVSAQLDKVNSEIGNYGNNSGTSVDVVAGSIHLDRKNNPAYAESEKLEGRRNRLNSLIEERQAQADAAEWETKYKGLNYGELLSEIRDEKSTKENEWLKSKANEIATSAEVENKINALEKENAELQRRTEDFSFTDEEQAAAQDKIRDNAAELADLKPLLVSKQKGDKIAEYESVVNNPDFANKGSVVAPSPEGYDTDYWTYKGLISDSSYLNEQEKAVLNYLYNSGESEKAMEYSELIKPRLNQRRTEDLVKSSYEFANENAGSAAIGSILSLGTNLVSGIGAVEDLGNRFIGQPIDVNSPAHTPAHMTNAYRSGVRDQIDNEAGAWLYDTGMSAADSAVSMAVSVAISGGVSAAFESAGKALSKEAVQKMTAGTMSTIMSSQVATNTVIDAKERGLSDDQAVTLGVLYGAVEGLSEKYSIEAIIKDPKSISSALGKAFVAEGSEEVASNFGSRAVDLLVSGDKAELRQQYQNYIKQGFSDKEALTMTLYNMVGEDASAFLAGGLSGVAMSGTHMALAGVSNEVQQAKARTELENLNAEELVKPENRETLNEIIKSGKYLDKNSKGYKLADRLENAVNADEQINAKDVKQLRREIVTQGRKIAKEDSKRLDSVTKDFTDEEKSTTSILGEKLRRGESLSNQEVKFLKNNEKILKAVSQYSEIDEDSVIELADSERFKNNFRYYKSNGNGLIEHDGSEFRGTVEIKSIDSKTGEATYNLIAPDNTVTTAKASEISFKDKNEADLHRAAANFRNVNEANAFIENYDGGDIKNYVNEWNLFSNYGRLGFNQSQISNRTDGKGINTASKEAAYKYGMDAFKSFAQAQYLKSTALEISAADFSYQKGTYTNSVSETKKMNLTAQQKGAIRFLRTLSYFGVNVEVFESKTNDKGNYVGENGSYDRATKTLRVDVNAGLDNVEQTVTEAARHGMFLNVGHELTHTAEQGKGYLKLRSEIVRTLDMNKISKYINNAAHGQDV